MMPDNERLARLEQSQEGQDREIRDLKTAIDRLGKKIDTANGLMTQLVRMEPDLTKLIDDEKERRGAMKLGRWAVGGSFLAVLGSAIAGVWQFFAKGPL